MTRGSFRWEVGLAQSAWRAEKRSQSACDWPKTDVLHVQFTLRTAKDLVNVGWKRSFKHRAADVAQPPDRQRDLVRASEFIDVIERRL